MSIIILVHFISVQSIVQCIAFMRSSARINEWVPLCSYPICLSSTYNLCANSNPGSFKSIIFASCNAISISGGVRKEKKKAETVIRQLSGEEREVGVGEVQGHKKRYENRIKELEIRKSKDEKTTPTFNKMAHLEARL